jgi:hypothetical protein
VSVRRDAESVPGWFELEQNYPNPFNPSTVIEFQLTPGDAPGAGARDVRLVVYDLLGREVATLMNEKLAAGRYAVTFEASGLASGTYIYRLTAGDRVAAKRMTVVK